MQGMPELCVLKFHRLWVSGRTVFVVRHCEYGAKIFELRDGERLRVGCGERPKRATEKPERERPDDDP